MKNNDVLFYREKMEFLISALKMSMFFRNIKKEKDDKEVRVEINILKNWLYIITQNISDDKKINKHIIEKLKDDFEKINDIFKEDIKDLNRASGEELFIENESYNMWCDFFAIYINIKNKYFLRKKWILIYLLEETIELNEDDQELEKKLTKLKCKIEKIDYKDSSENSELFEKYFIQLLNEKKDIYNDLINGLSFSKSYLHQLHTEKEWGKIFKKYKEEKALIDDHSSEYMDFIKLNAYIYWISLISKNKPLNLVTS